MDHIIQTKRLTLRPVKLSDAKDFARLASDYEISKMTGSIPHPFPLLSAEVRIMIFEAAWRRGAEYAYAISRTGHDFMGITSLFQRGEDRNFELGYWLGKPFWGQGYMPEACKALIETGCAQLGLTQIEAGVFTDNSASISVLKKLGFKSTGTKEKYFSIARGHKAESRGFLFDASPA